MKHHPVSIHSIAIFVLALLAVVLSGRAQDAAIVDEAKEKANSIMADPRLRNMLRPIRENPEAALEGVKIDPDGLDASRLDPEDAVRQMTKAFAENKDKVDPEKLKSAVAMAKESGLVEKASAAVNQLAPSATDLLKDVPATRPAPGISGGVPTPVAMPVEPGGSVVPESPAAPVGAQLPPDAVVENTSVEILAGAEPTTPMIPDSPGLNPGDIPDPQPLAKKYPRGSGGAFPSGDKQHMEILSNESTMDNTRGVLLFTGNVFVDHPEFEITCGKLEIQMAKGVGMDGSGAGESDAAFKRAIASGGMVEIKRTSLDEKGQKKTQVAIARIADYDAVTKDIVLSGGPPYIQDGDSFVKTNSEDARIIMRGNGKYEISGSSPRHQIRIPIQQKETGGATTGGGSGNPLDAFR